MIIQEEWEYALTVRLAKWYAGIGTTFGVMTTWVLSRHHLTDLTPRTGGPVLLFGIGALALLFCASVMLGCAWQYRRHHPAPADDMKR